MKSNNQNNIDDIQYVLMNLSFYELKIYGDKYMVSSERN